MQLMLYKKIATDKGSIGALKIPNEVNSGWLTMYRYNADSMYKNISLRIPKKYLVNRNYAANGAIIKDSPIAGTLFYNLSYSNDFQSGYVTLNLTIDSLTTYVYEMVNNPKYGKYEYIYNLYGSIYKLDGDVNIPKALAFKYRNEGKLEKYLKINKDPAKSKYTTFKKFVMHHRVATPEHWNTSLATTSVAPWLTAFGSYMGDTVQGGRINRPNRTNSNQPLHLSGMINGWLGGEKYDGGEFDYIEYLPDLQTADNNIVNMGIKKPQNLYIGGNDTPSTEGIEKWQGSSFLGIIGYMNIMPGAKELYNYAPLDTSTTINVGGMFTKAESYDIKLYNQLSIPYHIEFRYYLNVNQDVEIRVYAVPGEEFKVSDVAIDDWQTAEYTNGFKLLQTIPITPLRIPYFVDPALKEVVTTINQLNFNPVAFLLLQVVQAIIDLFGNGFGSVFDKFVEVINTGMKSIDPKSSGVNIKWADIVKVVDGVPVVQVENLAAQGILYGIVGYLAYGLFNKLDLDSLKALLPGWGEVAASIGDAVIGILKSIGALFAGTMATYLTMGVKTMFKYLNKVGYISDLGSSEQTPMSDYVGFGSSNNPFSIEVSTPYFQDITESEVANKPRILDMDLHGDTKLKEFALGYNYLTTDFSEYLSSKNYGIAIRDMWIPGPSNNLTLNLPEYIIDEGKEILESTGGKLYSKNSV